MTDPAISLIPVRAAELEVGKPLRQAIFDWHGKLLMAPGSRIESREQLESLLSTGFVQDDSWDGVGAGGGRQQGPSEKPVGAAEETRDEASDASAATVVALDDIRWTVGETLYLQLADNPSIRYTVRLIGFVRNKTVFATAPAVDGKFEFIRDGQLFIVRAFSGKKAYAFTATAVRSVHSPHPYLHLSYPREVRCTTVRRAVRAEVKIVASVTLDGAPHSAAAVLTDLSMGGAAGTARQALGRKGAEGRIKFKVHAAEQDEYLNLRMALRSIAPAENGEGFKHGFEFLGVSIHDRLMLSAFVHQTLVD